MEGGRQNHQSSLRSTQSSLCVFTSISRSSGKKSRVKEKQDGRRKALQEVGGRMKEEIDQEKWDPEDGGGREIDWRSGCGWHWEGRGKNSSGKRASSLEQWESTVVLIRAARWEMTICLLLFFIRAPALPVHQALHTQQDTFSPTSTMGN